MADQQKRPGADISDLKARLGLKQPAAAPPPGAPRQTGGVMPAQQAGRPGAVPAPAGVSPASRPPIPGAPAQAPIQQAPPAPPPGHDPYSSMKPVGKQFDLRLIDDGKEVVSVQAKGGKGGLVITAIIGLIAFGVGAGFGMANVGRSNFNTANAAAKVVEKELKAMQETLTGIGKAVAMSQQRLAAKKVDVLTYDPLLITEFEGLKLDPRPDTGKIFRVDYYRLEDMVVDRLFNYYYDSIALYGEVERHVKRTKADQESLKGFVDKQAADTEKANAKYGVVFDLSGKLTVANLVEVGKTVCKDGTAECANADDMEGFEVRAGLGSNWYKRKVKSKSDGDRVVPLKPTPLMDAVMSGSPDQVRAEAYKQRVANIRGIVGRLTAAQKELFEGVGKAAKRPDLFTLF